MLSRDLESYLPYPSLGADVVNATPTRDSPARLIRNTTIRWAHLLLQLWPYGSLEEGATCAFEAMSRSQHRGKAFAYPIKDLRRVESRARRGQVSLSRSVELSTEGRGAQYIEY